jgi:hypothetical protein
MTNLCYIKHKYITKNRKLHYMAIKLCYSEFLFPLWVFIEKIKDQWLYTYLNRLKRWLSVML